MRSHSVVALLATACVPHLGVPDVSYQEPIPLAMVHPEGDARWYVWVDTGEHGRRLFFLDTGYAHTTCDDDFLADLGVEATGRVRVRGEAGNVAASRARLPDLDVGGHRIRGLTCVVRDLNTTSSIADPAGVAVAGVIGSDVLRPFRVEIDPERAEVLLLDPTTASPLDGEGVVPLRREQGFGLRPKVVFTADGHVIRAIVDTGASGTHVDGRRLGLTPTRILEGVAIRGTGASGHKTLDLALYRLEAVELAGHLVGPVMFTDRPRPRWVLPLLGLNVLSRFRQEYDFRGRKARFTPIDRPAVPRIP